MIAIIDYQTGNLRSVENALHRLGAEYIVTADAATIRPRVAARCRQLCRGHVAFARCQTHTCNKELTPTSFRHLCWFTSDVSRF